jgi:uncharacterized protein YkwD
MSLMQLPTNLKFIFLPLLALVAVFALSAASAPSAEASCRHSGKSVKNISKKNARQAMLCLMNKGRSAKNLKRNGDLERAAQNHAGVMASKNCFSHQCPGEPSLKERVARTGYLSGSSNYGLGEVIIVQRAKASPRRLVRKWLESSSHASVIRKSSFDHVGIGLSIRNGFVWSAADFGYR